VILNDPDAKAGGVFRGFKKVLQRRDIVALCVFIFMADSLSGIVIPTFSIYAQGLGASLVLIGVLSSAVGITSMITAIPSGMLSDRIGRRRVLLFGMIVWTVALISFAIVDHPYLLFPGRILMGAAIILTFGIGAAYMGDITSGEERGPAFGLYATAMGLGFAVGPLIGGPIADNFGIEWSYAFGAMVAIAGFFFGLRFLPHDPPHEEPAATESGTEEPEARTGFFQVLLYPPLLITSVAVFLQSTAFMGAIQNFFPLYGQNVAIISAGFIATMFSVRAFASTGVRIPMGILANTLTTSGVMTISLVIMGLSLIGISQTTDTTLLTIFLALEGIGFGGFVTAGQAFIAEISTNQTRGTAMGIYRMAASVGSAGGPVLLGVIASQWSLGTVFLLTGIVVLIGAMGVAWTVPWRRIILGRPQTW
jgi:MFS transporter, DHA1 family, multidrug resistance protein